MASAKDKTLALLQTLFDGPSYVKRPSQADTQFFGGHKG